MVRVHLFATLACCACSNHKETPAKAPVVDDAAAIQPIDAAAVGDARATRGLAPWAKNPDCAAVLPPARRDKLIGKAWYEKNTSYVACSFIAGNGYDTFTISVECRSVVEVAGIAAATEESLDQAEGDVLLRAGPRRTLVYSDKNRHRHARGWDDDTPCVVHIEVPDIPDASRVASQKVLDAILDELAQPPGSQGSGSGE